jgi:phosphoribosylamine--glycine ligase
MGAYSPLSDLPDAEADELIARFHRPILDELARRGSPFRGALYAGLMLTATGPVLLECNARFGDPETQVIVPRLAAPLGPLLLAAARGRLVEAARPLGLVGTRLPSVPIAAVGIVLAAAGYPEAPRRDDPISGLDRARDGGALVFHSGTAAGGPAVAGGPAGYRTDGGRIVTVVGRGRDLEAARAQAEASANLIAFDGLQRRHDIGADGVPLGAAR